MKKKIAPPGFEPHKVVHRLDGWIVDPANPGRVPSGIANVINRGGLPDGRSEIARIRARMESRQRALEAWQMRLRLAKRAKGGS